MSQNAPGEADFRTARTNVDVDVRPTPPKAALSAARPNPFRAATMIRFDLPRSGAVELAVFDVAGREVVRLADGILPAGTHERRWNPDARGGAAAGVYFARLSFEGRTETRTLVLQR